MNASDMAYIIAETMNQRPGYHAKQVTETTVEICTGTGDNTIWFEVRVQ